MSVFLLGQNIMFDKSVFERLTTRRAKSKVLGNDKIYSTHDVAQNNPIERLAAIAQVLALHSKVSARSAATIGARLK